MIACSRLWSGVSSMKASGMLGANLVVKNKQGEVCLALKRKIDEVTGRLYYIFEMHLDRVPTDGLVKFQQAWDAVRYYAFREGIALYDISEITERVLKEIDDRAKEANELEVRVRDHASGMIHTVIVSAQKVAKRRKNVRDEER